MELTTVFLDFIQSIYLNSTIRIALLSLLLAQAFKIISHLALNRRLDFKKLTEPGGMPSSHTTMVIALTTHIGLISGFNSINFGISFIFSCIVMYDAAGVRQAAGKQAEVLNNMIDDLFHDKGFREERLKEILGHTQPEVFAGMVLGIILAFFLT